MNFQKALEENRLDKLKRFDKSDLHNHATRGGNINHFVPSHFKKIPEIPRKLRDLNHMQKWYEENIKLKFEGAKGYEQRLKSAFKQATDDGITKLCMSFGIGDSVLYNSLEDFVKVIKACHNSQAPHIDFIPEISFGRWMDVQKCMEDFKELQSFDYFKSIDLIGDESLTVHAFKPLYRLAEKHNFIKKAHIGEFSGAEAVRETVEILELDQVHHGIAAASSKEVMRYLRNNRIQLNICPTSNVILDVVNSYKEHPINRLFFNEIPVTINSDDMLIFNQSVSEDYMNLYRHQVLSANDLERIRQIGLG